MAQPSKLVGSMSCWNPNCGEDIPVKEGEKGAMNLSCPWCGLSAYAKAGTEAHGDATALMKPAKAAAPVVVPVAGPEPVPAPAPAPKKPAAAARTVFG